MLWNRLRLAILAALIALPIRSGALSFEEERALGQRFDLEARQRLPLVDDPEVVGYVERLGRRIVRGLNGSVFDYHFRVVADGSINAFAVPGGYVYVHTGLLLRAGNDDEVAAVLAHEVAHVHNHHLARQQEKSQALSYAALLGMLAGIVQPALGSVAAAASATAQLQYQREFEQEADFSGARYLSAAGFDPGSMLDFFKKMGEARRASPTAIPPYLLTHPLTDERMNHLEAVLKKQQWATHPRPTTGIGLLDAQARARVRTESPADAVHALRQVAEENQDDGLAQYQLGVVALEVGQYDLAATALKSAAVRHVELAHRELGRLALRTRDFETAKRELRRAVSDNGADPGARLDLARAYEATADLDAARDQYERSVELAPELAAAHQGLGVLLGRSGRQGDGFYHVATAMRLRGDLGGAALQYARAVKQLPEVDPRRADAEQWATLLEKLTGTRAR